MPQKTCEGLPENHMLENHKMPQNRTLSVFCSKSAHVFFLEMPNFKYARKSWNVSFSNHLTYLKWTDSRAKYILHMFWDISRNHIIWFTTHVLGFLSQYFFIQWNSLSQPWIRRPWLLGRVFERMTLSHQNVWILGNIYTVFQFRVPSNDHNKIEIYIAKSIFLSEWHWWFSIAGWHIWP